MEASEIVEAYNVLIKRAHDVVDKAPYWAHIWADDWDHTRLWIDGDTVILTWQETESDYDGWTTHTERAEFPLHLLTCPNEELGAWKKEQAKLYERKELAQRAALMTLEQDRERAAYEALKRKYG
jgi:hypothetical protein